MKRKFMFTFSQKEVQEALAQYAREMGNPVDPIDRYAEVSIQTGHETLKGGLALVVTLGDDAQTASE